MKAWLGTVGYKTSLTFSDSQDEAQKALRQDLSAVIPDTNEFEDFRMERIVFLDDMENCDPVTVRAELVMHHTLTETVRQLNADDAALNIPGAAQTNR